MKESSQRSYHDSQRNNSAHQHPGLKMSPGQHFAPKFVNEAPKNSIGKQKGRQGTSSRNDQNNILNQDYPSSYLKTDNVAKKQRRLRKNFEVLAHGVKNAHTTKREKPITFERRANSNTGYHTQVAGSFYGSFQSTQNKPSNHNLSQQLYNPVEEMPESHLANRKLSHGENIYHSGQKIYSRGNQPNAKNSHMYSHISIKPEFSPNRTKLAQLPQPISLSKQNQSQRTPIQSRNQPQVISIGGSHVNPSNNSGVVIGNQTQANIVKVPEKVMRRYMPSGRHPPNMLSGTQISDKPLENYQVDINIYNNSFILNTTGKKQASSASQSRSNSIKRGSSNVQGLVQKNMGNKKQNATQHSYNDSHNSQRMMHNTQGNLSRNRQVTDAYAGNKTHMNNLFSSMYKKAQLSGLFSRGQSQRSIANNRGSFEEVINETGNISAQRPVSQGLSSKRRQRQKTEGFDSNQLSQEIKCQTSSLLKQGKAYLSSKDFVQAIETFKQCIEINPTCYESKFFLGISFLDSSQHEEALNYFIEVNKHSKEHSEMSFILLSITHKRMNDSAKQIETLSRCIKVHPKYPDAYLARGQALIAQEKAKDALLDFKAYTNLMPTHHVGFVGIGDSLRAIDKNSEAVDAYTNAIQLLSGNVSEIIQTHIKRAMSYFHATNFQKALNDLEFVLKKDPKNCKAHFYIGKIKALDSKQQQDAILHFEQVVKYNRNELYAGNSLFEIAKLRLKEKDFYEAYFNLKRAIDNNFTSKRMQMYKDFTEGVLYMIKRKIKKGVQILSDLLEILVNNPKNDDHQFHNYLKHQVYIYRAYGFVAIEKYEQAIDDIKKSGLIKKVDAASVYNKLLSKGILRMDHEDYIMATKYFQKASLKFPENKDTYCLSIIGVVRSFSYSFEGKFLDDQGKRQKVFDTKLFMDKAIQNCIQVREPSLFFFRGLLKFHMHMFVEALEDFSIAIEEEEEPTASYYLARGRCYACLSILSEAMKDLSIALNLDESLQEAYVNRGKCAYLLGDNNLAFLDFQRLILTDPKNPQVHIYAGNLLMTTGAYQDAIKAFLNADTVEPTASAAFQRSRCQCALTDIPLALEEMETAIALCPNDKLMEVDKKCLEILQLLVSSKEEPKNLGHAKNLVDKLIKVASNGTYDKLQRYHAPQTIQIIPNVNRIKIEKVVVARKLLENQTESKSIESLSVDINQSIDLESLKMIREYNYYYENIFGLEDMLLYRAITNFYMKNYKEAAEDFLSCKKKKIEQQDSVSQFASKEFDYEMEGAMSKSKSSTPMLSQNSSKTDLSDVGLCSLNVNETLFNQMVCLILAGEFDRACEICSEIIFGCPQKYQKFFFLLRGLLFSRKGDQSKSQKDLQKFKKYDLEMYTKYFDKKQSLEIEPFPIKQRLCAQFDWVKCSIDKSLPPILLKPSFSMPFIKPPNMIPNVDEETVESEFNLKQIDAPMPEAPWIRRCKHGIRFTDEIQEVEDQEGIFDEKQEQEEEKKKDKEETKKTKEVPQKRNISEQILKQNRVDLFQEHYFDDEDDKDISDKFKISLLDDSKFDDATIEPRCLEEHGDLAKRESSDPPEEDSSEEEGFDLKSGMERDSMVLMGDTKLQHARAPKGSSAIHIEEQDDQ